jgi:hypothetical protein
MSSHVHRDGPHQITVEDDQGNRTRFVTTCCGLEIEHTAASPRLSPTDALDLAGELSQWATAQYCRRRSA